MEEILNHLANNELSLEVLKNGTKESLEEATNNYERCSDEILDILDEMMNGFAEGEYYELSGVVRDFKIELVKRTGFLEEPDKEMG